MSLADPLGREVVANGEVLDTEVASILQITGRNLVGALVAVELSFRVRSDVARILPTLPTLSRVSDGQLVVAQIRTIGIGRVTGVVVNLVSVHEVGVHVYENTIPTKRSIQTAGEERSSLGYSMLLSSVVVIGSGLVACIVKYIVAVCIHYIPQRITVSGINTCPLFHVPCVDVLTFLNQLVNRRCLLLNRCVIR